MVKYIPKLGDLVYVDFGKTVGHEQNGSRPAIVLSSKTFNQFTNMALICPITTNTKVFPTHYELKDAKKIKGSVLGEHIRSVDFVSRNMKFIEHASKNDLENVLLLVKCFFEND